MLGCLLLGAVTARAPVDIIVDTDLSIDVDDVGAMCVAHALVDRGEARLLAVIHDTALPEGVGAVSVINEYYGRQIPLGAYRGRVGAPGSDLAQPGWTNQGRGRYVDSLLSEFASPVRHASEVADAVTVYREALNRAFICLHAIKSPACNLEVDCNHCRAQHGRGSAMLHALAQLSVCAGWELREPLRDACVGHRAWKGISRPGWNKNNPAWFLNTSRS